MNLNKINSRTRIEDRNIIQSAIDSIATPSLRTLVGRMGNIFEKAALRVSRDFQIESQIQELHDLMRDQEDGEESVIIDFTEDEFLKFRAIALDKVKSNMRLLCTLATHSGRKVHHL